MLQLPLWIEAWNLSPSAYKPGGVATASSNNSSTSRWSHLSLCGAWPALRNGSRQFFPSLAPEGNGSTSAHLPGSVSDLVRTVAAHTAPMLPRRRGWSHAIRDEHTSTQCTGPCSHCGSSTLQENGQGSDIRQLS